MRKTYAFLVVKNDARREVLGRIDVERYEAKLLSDALIEKFGEVVTDGEVYMTIFLGESIKQSDG